LKIDWLPVAEKSLQTQLDFIEEHHPSAALDLGETIETALIALAEYPQMGRPGRVKGTRELVITGSPYIITYRLKPASIVIVRFFHGAQKWLDTF
jgi:toxin ParE1/3/4